MKSGLKISCICSIVLLLTLSLIQVFPVEAVHIPPTPAISKIHTKNGTAQAMNYSTPFNFVAIGNITITASNNSKTIYFNASALSGKNGINGTNGSAGTGSYNQTLANNVLVNSGGFKINFVNGTHNPVRVVNSNGGNQVNVTISDSGLTSAVQSLNFTTSSDFDFNFHGNASNISLVGQVFKFIIKPAVVLTNGTAQIIIKALTLDQLILGGNANGNNNNFTALNYVNATHIFQGPNQVFDTVTNKGTSGIGIASSNANILSILKLIPSNSVCTITSNSTNVIFSCTDTNTAQLKNADGANYGLFGSRINATQNTIKTVGAGSNISITFNSTHITINSATWQNNTGTNLGVNGIGPYTSTTSAGVLQFLKLVSANSNCVFSSNSTNVILTCTTASITTLNSQTGPTVNIVAAYHNSTNIGNSSNTITVYDKLNKLLTNGTAQNATKLIGFNAQARIMGLMDNYTFTKSSYTALPTDDNIYVDTTTGNKTVTIPIISTMGNGKILTIKKTDYSTNYVEIIPMSTTINGFANMNLTNPMDSVTIQNNNTIWQFSSKVPQFTVISNPVKTNTNNWYGSWVNQGTPTTFSMSNNTLYAVPFTLARTTSIAKIESEVTTPGTGSNCRMAIYTDNGKGYPSNKVSGSDVAVLTANSATTLRNSFISNIFLQPQNYYLGENCNNGSTSGGIGTIINDTSGSSPVTTVSASTNATQNISITVANTSNRLLVVGIGYETLRSDANDRISSVKIGGLSFTKALNKTVTGNGFSVDSEIWYLTNPPTGAVHITITPVAPSITYSGVFGVYDLSSTSSTQNGATGTSTGTTTPATVSITPTNTNAWIIDSPMTFGTTITMSLPNKQFVWEKTVNTNQDNGGSQVSKTPTIGASNTLSWTLGGTITKWTDASFEIIPCPSCGTLSGTNPVLRAIPTSSIGPFLGMPSTMGATNGGTMYSVTTALTSSVNSLPDPFPTTGNIATTSVPEILINVVG